MATTPSTYTSSTVNRAGTLISELNIVVPRAYRDFIDKFQFVPYVMMNELAGNTMATDNKLFYWYESKGRQMSFVTVAPTPTPVAVNVAFDFTLSAGDIYGGTAYKSLPAVGMILYNARTGVESRVTNVTGQGSSATQVVTIVPVVSGTNATSIAGDELQSRGFKYVGEASDYTATQVQTIDKFTNYATQIRIDSKFTDLSMAEAIDFEYDGQRYYKYKQLADDNKKFLLQKELALMDSFLTTNTTAGASPDGSTSGGSAGVIQQTQANGLQIGYGTFSAQTTFANIERQLDSQGAPQEYDWLCDVKQHIAIQNALGNDFNNGAVIYAQNQDSAALDLGFGFKSFAPYQRKFNFTRYLPFSEAAFYGSSANGTTRSDFGLLIPKGTSTDAVTRNVVPRFNIRYQDILGNGQKVQIAETGGLAKNPTSPKMELVVSQVAYYGVQVMGANQYAIVKGS
jgi:hypothetical protein